MTLGEILQEIRYLTPNNGFEDDELTKHVNLTLQKLYRMFPLPDKVVRFQTLQGIGGPYELPDDCPTDRITKVVMNDISLRLVDEGERIDTACYMIAVGGLFLYPVPQDAWWVYVYYKNRPEMMTASNSSAIPDFPEDYHMMIVYDVATWVAATMRDTTMMNNFVSSFNEIALQAKQDFRRIRSHRVKIVEDWWS